MTSRKRKKEKEKEKEAFVKVEPVHTSQSHT